ncbi:MAG TPA: hypothetical protein DD640_08770, partial [Clostridiales bacterium]|nr:hypothetical protein [Clostridiales bacterium]
MAMKRIFLILPLILALLLAACSGPILQTSPSLNNSQQTTSPDNGLTRAADYAALIKLVRAAQSDTRNHWNRYYTADMVGALTDAQSRNSAEKAPGAGNDYSKTNIQVEGVDEADIIKTDGRYLYLVANNRFYIVDAGNPAQMKVIANVAFVVNVETEKYVTGETPVEMYLDVVNDRLTLIVNGWLSEKIEVIEPTETKPTEPAPTDETKPTEPAPTDETKPTETKPTETAPSSEGGSEPAGSGSETAVPDAAPPDSGTSEKADAGFVAPRYYYNNYIQYTTTRVYDLSDKTAPKMVRQFSQEGYYVTSRKIGAAIYVVTSQYQYSIYFDEKTEPDPADIFPATRDDLDPIAAEDWDTIAPDKISILPGGDISNQMVLTAIDTLDDGSTPDILAILGSSGSVYASTENLYVAAWNYKWDGKEDSIATYSTDIYRFRLDGAQISEAGKGSVPGSIINQFSMDEHEGYFRIATTTGEVWTSEGNNVAKNNVYILDGSLNIAGSVTGLAPGESIKSVRFMGDQVYVVTFRNIDPLFVIDLSQPTSPVVLGQLKIPGYSTYLHPYAENMLLGFGYDVRNEGDNAYNMGIKVSLFDISDFANPTEVSTILLGSRGSYGDILYNHKTLLFSREKNL